MGCSSSKAADATPPASSPTSVPASTPASTSTSVPASVPASTSPTTSALVPASTPLSTQALASVPTSALAVTLAASAVSAVIESAATVPEARVPVENISKIDAETSIQAEQQQQEPDVSTQQQHQEQQQSNDVSTKQDTMDSATSWLHVRVRQSELANNQETNSKEPSYSIDVHTAYVTTQPLEPTDAAVVIESPSDSLWVRIRDNKTQNEYFVNTRHMFGTKQAPDDIDTQYTCVGTSAEQREVQQQQQQQEDEEEENGSKLDSMYQNCLAIESASQNQVAAELDVTEALNTFCVTLGGSHMLLQFSPKFSENDEDSQPEEDSSVARTVTPISQDSITPASTEESGSEESAVDNIPKDAGHQGGVAPVMAGRPRPAGIKAPEVPETDERVEEPHESVAEIRARFQTGQAFTPESATHNRRKSVTNESLAQDLGSVSVKDKAKTFKFAPTPTKASTDDAESMHERMDSVSNRKTAVAMKDYWQTVEEINSTVVTRKDF